jgi:hypothetical protein
MENHDHDYLIESDRQSAIQYITDNRHVLRSQPRLTAPEYLASIDDETLRQLVTLIKGFIRDFPDHYQERS